MKGGKKSGKKIAIVVVALIVVLSCGVTGVLSVSGAFGDIHVLSEAEDGQIRVACVGDSITYGAMVFDHAHKSYPAQLGALLGTGYVVNNYGYSGRAAHPDTDMPYTAEKLYRQSLSFAPDIVVIMLGTNDTRTGNWHGQDAFVQAYGAILDSYIQLPSSPEVIIMAPPPAFSFVGKVRYHIDATLVKNEVNAGVRLLAEEKGLTFVDLYEVFDGKSNLFVDGVHPSAKGATLLAETVYKTIAKTKLANSETMYSVA